MSLQTELTTQSSEVAVDNTAENGSATKAHQPTPLTASTPANQISSAVSGGVGVNGITYRSQDSKNMLTDSARKSQNLERNTKFAQPVGCRPSLERKKLETKIEPHRKCGTQLETQICCAP